MTPRNRVVFLALAISLSPINALSNRQTDKTLARAERYAWRDNWEKARPLFARAQEEYEAQGHLKNAVAAKIGLIQSKMHTTPSAHLLQLLERELENPIVRGDLSLQLKCFVAKGYLEEQSDLLASRHSWNQVLEIAKRIGNKDWERRASGQLGVLAWTVDVNSATAIRLVGNAVVDAIGSGDIAAQVYFLERVGTLLSYSKRYKAAMNYFRKALMAASLEEDYPFPLDVYISKSRGLIEMGQPNEAMLLIDKALKRTNDNLNAMAELFIYRAKVISSSNVAEAIAYLKRAVDLCVGNGFARTLADANEAIAETYLRQGDYEKAQRHQLECIKVTRKRHGTSYMPQRLGRLAEIAQKRGRLPEASSLYDEFTKITEMILTNSASRYFAESIIDWMSDIYINHFVLALDHLKDPAQGFTILERARGRTIAVGLRSALVDQIKKISDRTPYDTEISRIQSKLLLDKTASDLREVLDEDDLFLAENLAGPAIAKRHEYIRQVTSTPVSLEALQATLRPDEIVLDYVISEPISYCLQITQKAIAANRLPGRGHVDALIDQYLYEARLKKDVRSTRRELYSVLLPSVENLDRYRRLTIIPDQNLHLVAFESLIDGSGKLLLESHLVGYVQSATILHLLRSVPQPKQNHTKTLLAFGDPLYKRNSKYLIERSSVPIDGFNFPRLPGTLDEVLSISYLFPNKATVLVGKDATEESLKSQNPLSQFKILHFAVHGYADPNFPERSALILTSKRNSSEDGLLQDREIVDLVLSADLITLSACDSGFGKLYGQEGMASLVKSFMFAGAKTVVASLWNVDDRLTTELMTSFYSNLAKGDGKGVALRNAKLALLKTHGSLPPYSWAGFTMWGDSVFPIDLTN